MGGIVGRGRMEGKRIEKGRENGELHSHLIWGLTPPSAAIVINYANPEARTCLQRQHAVNQLRRIALLHSDVANSTDIRSGRREGTCMTASRALVTETPAACYR